MQVFTQRGGVRLDNFNASYPFAAIKATNSAIEISLPNRRYNFPKQEIVRLSIHRGLISYGLRIEHRIQSYPQYVVFWIGFGLRAAVIPTFIEKLEKLGYAVQR